MFLKTPGVHNQQTTVSLYVHKEAGGERVRGGGECGGRFYHNWLENKLKAAVSVVPSSGSGGG